MTRNDLQIEAVHVHQTTTEVVYADDSSTAVVVNLDGTIASYAGNPEPDLDDSLVLERIERAQEISATQAWIPAKRKRLFG